MITTAQIGNTGSPIVHPLLPGIEEGGTRVEPQRRATTSLTLLRVAAVPNRLRRVEPTLTVSVPAGTAPLAPRLPQRRLVRKAVLQLAHRGRHLPV